MQQRTDEWYEARLGKATASRFKDVMAKNTTAAYKNYRAELVLERITGKHEEGYTSPAMQWGTDYEPVARTAYELETGRLVTETGLVVHPTLAAGASPDGLVGDDGVLEIKCPNSATHIETLRTQKVPYQYYWQVMGQMWLTGRKWCDFVSYDPRMPENAQMIVIRLERDEEKIQDLEYEVKRFLQEVDNDEAFIRNYS